MIGIYKITNQINGKCYIGQSINIKQRWKAHRTRAFNSDEIDKPFYRAIRKYGLQNFNFEVIEECKKEELNEREKYWIAYYNSNDKNFGYNLTIGGDSSSDASKMLLEGQVQEIRRLLLDNVPQEKIAKKFNVSQAVISYINNGKEYYHKEWDYPIRKEFKYERKHEQNYCLDCGKQIYYKSKRCFECSRIASRVYKRPSREELKKLIREKSLAEVARMYGICDIRKWCDGYNLPHLKREINSYSDKEWELI